MTRTEAIEPAARRWTMGGRLPALGAAVGLLFVGVAACEVPEEQMEPEPGAELGEGAEYGIVIHGGAGVITRESMDPELEELYHESLDASLRAGYEILEEGGAAVDAVQAAVQVMEDDSIYNAGRGSVFTADETHELDAAIMDGSDRNAGAVTGVTGIRNPVDLARVIMDQSDHVFMAGEGAETFADQFDLETVDQDYFFTEMRWEALEEARADEESNGGASLRDHDDITRYLGTVGAVARDQDGDLAASTSTGGMTNKQFGRIGDVPVIGAGTYANNESCAVSTTGWGEYFIRNVVAHDICARMQHGGRTLADASDDVILGVVPDHGGYGGAVAIDRDGHTHMNMSTEGMYRGEMLAGEEPVTKIYDDEGGG